MAILNLKPKRQCMAIAEATGQQCTRTFRTAIRSRYCWQHLPKWGFLISVLFSALFGLCVDNVYRWVFPSTESQQIVLAERSIKADQRLLAELDAEIANLNLVLDLTEKLKATDGEAFLVRIRNFERPKNKNFEILLEVADSWGADRKYRWGFMFESFFMEDRDKFTSSHGLMGLEAALGAIPLPLSLLQSTRKPFKKVRDLDECAIEIFAPSRVARHVSQIRLLANSGFQFTKHTIVYSRVVRDSDWEETDYALGNNFSSKWKSDEKYSWLRGRSSNSDLRINVLKSALVQNGNALPEIFRIQY